MDMTRRDFLGLGKGAAAAAVLAGLGLAGTPRNAKAIIGIDDAVLGAVVLAIASLGGYALYSQYVSNQSLAAIGGSFSDFVSVTGNREAAIQAAMAAAALHGIAGTEPDFERAGNLIASGEGAFLTAMQSAESTGRLALDGLVSGSDALVGMMRELVTGWLGSGLISDMPMTVPNETVIGTDGLDTLPIALGVAHIDTLYGWISNLVTPPISTQNAYVWLNDNWPNYSNGTLAGYMYIGNGCIKSASVTSNGTQLSITTTPPDIYEATLVKKSNPTRLAMEGSWNYNTRGKVIGLNGVSVTVTPGVIGGPLLPGVDRAADAPDVIGTSWDSVPIATDMVIDPTTGDITSAGSITLPSSVPTTAGDYAATLQGALAGVVADTIALPLSLEANVTVATPAGVASMPISEAIASETSLQLDYAPDIPIDPVLPPVDVPEGPWTPAVELPFMNVWPFNMIYTFIETMSRLGGN